MGDFLSNCYTLTPKFISPFICDSIPHMPLHTTPQHKIHESPKKSIFPLRRIKSVDTMLDDNTDDRTNTTNETIINYKTLKGGEKKRNNIIFRFRNLNLVNKKINVLPNNSKHETTKESLQLNIEPFTTTDSVCIQDDINIDAFTPGTQTPVLRFEGKIENETEEFKCLCSQIESYESDLKILLDKNEARKAYAQALKIELTKLRGLLKSEEEKGIDRETDIRRMKRSLGNADLEKNMLATECQDLVVITDCLSTQTEMLKAKIVDYEKKSDLMDSISILEPKKVMHSLSMHSLSMHSLSVKDFNYELSLMRQQVKEYASICANLEVQLKTKDTEVKQKENEISKLRDNSTKSLF